LRDSGPESANIRDTIERTQGLVGTDGIFSHSAADCNQPTKDACVMVEIVDGKWKLLP